MAAMQTISGLARFPARGAGTDAERRAARWLAGELRRSGRAVRLETFWCRPNWALAHAWHAALGLAGSLISVGSHRLGGVLILVAAVCVVADSLLGISPGRRLTRERASQNVVSAPPGRASGPDAAEARSGRPAPGPVRLVITANLDAGRTGLIHRPRLRRPAAALRRVSGGLSPGWLGWLIVMLVWALATAVARSRGSTGTLLGLAQLLPTVALVLAAALLLEHGTAEFGPAAGDNASGVAAAVALAAALTAGPPGATEVEIVLQGAGDGNGIGLRRYLRARRRERCGFNTIVLGICAAGSGTPRWWISDGQMLPLRYFPQLRRVAAGAAAQAPRLQAAPVRTRGGSPAWPAQLRRIPTLAIGALDRRGLVPDSHTEADTPGRVDAASIDRVVQFALLLVDELDDHLAERAAARSHAAAPAPAPAGQPTVSGAVTPV